MSFQESLYQAALERAAFFQFADPGLLRIQGVDRAAFVQRQTTNDIGALTPQQAVLSVLTSPTARILDVLYFFEEPAAAQGEVCITTITLPGRGAATFRFLKSRIFFNDQVSLADASQTYAQIDLFGPHAAAGLQQLGLESELPVHGVACLAFESQPLWILHTDPRLGLGFRLLLPADQAPALSGALQAAGSLSLEADIYDLLRIEAGLPGPAAELTDAYTPLETRLESAVSDRKGCYTGQEILARQVTYDKVTQKLAGLQLNGPAERGDRVWADSKPAGQITSTARSPRFGWIALAVLKRAYLEPGLEVAAGASLTEAQPAAVTPLPFSSGR